MSVILATILCGSCAAEHHRAHKLGTVVKHPGGRINWEPWDPKFGAMLRRHGHQADNARGGNALKMPRTSWAQPNPPERLPAYCKRHGPGSVPFVEVSTAHGRKVVNFTAAPEEQTG